MDARDRLAEIDGEIITLLPEYDAAIIGVGMDGCYTRAVYDRTRLLELLAAEVDSDDPETDAIEHFEYNILRSGPYVDGAPIYVTLFEGAGDGGGIEGQGESRRV